MYLIFLQFMQDGVFNVSHDLALVKLNAPVSMNPHIQVACLPQLNEELTIGERCFATGWGLTRGDFRFFIGLCLIEKKGAHVNLF